MNRLRREDNGDAFNPGARPAPIGKGFRPSGSQVASPCIEPGRSDVGQRCPLMDFGAGKLADSTAAWRDFLGSGCRRLGTKALPHSDGSAVRVLAGLYAEGDRPGIKDHVKIAFEWALK